MGCGGWRCAVCEVVCQLCCWRLAEMSPRVLWNLFVALMKFSSNGMAAVSDRRNAMLWVDRRATRSSCARSWVYWGHSMRNRLMLSGVSGHLRQNGDADRLILKRWALSGQYLVHSHMRSDACFRVWEVVICMKEPVSSLLSIFERWVNLGDAAHIHLHLSVSIFF